MLIHLKDGSSHFIDFRETAPAAAYADMYLDARGRPDANRSTIGPLSAGVPGTVAGLEYAPRALRYAFPCHAHRPGDRVRARTSESMRPMRSCLQTNATGSRNFR